MDEINDTIPYGFCHCGCGQKTRIANSSDATYGWVRGQPKRYLRGHNGKKHDDASRFWERVDKSGGDDSCWLWTGYCDSDGRGRTYWQGKQDGAHRIAFRITHGKIPDELHVLHTCDNPRCVNPHHLFLGTNLDNVRDRCQKGRTRVGHRFKLTDDDIAEIRRLASDGVFNQIQLGDLYGVTSQYIGQILHNLARTRPYSDASATASSLSENADSTRTTR